MFSGCYVATITPFKDGGRKVDESALKNLLEFLISAGVSGVVPCGSTGESATLSYEEHEQVIALTVKYVNHRIKVVAGTGSNNTSEAIRLTRFAREAGCDGALLISPYYNKPTQEGLYRHFRKISEEVDIPIMLYNIQSRTAVNIEPETVARLVKDCPNIVAIKEASGNLEQMARIKMLAPNIAILSGDDALTLPVLAIGGCGVVSVLANIAPRVVVEMLKRFEHKDIAGAQEIYYQYLPLVKALFLETNPIPVKTACALIGLCQPDLRLPLCPMSEKNRQVLEKILKEYQLIK